MSINLVLRYSMAAALMRIAVERSDAQIVTITSTNYVAGPPPKADPQGTWSVPANSGMWKVVFDYGTITAGTFTPDVTIGVGGTVIIPAAGGDGTWGPLGQETLKNPLPMGASVRAQLQKKNANNVWEVQVTSYEPVAGTGKL